MLATMGVKEVLEQSTINGTTLTLPAVQLDRKVYMDVSKKLELIGGKWNRKAQGFVFQEDPSYLIGDLINGDNRNLKKEYQFFETPENICHRICSNIPFTAELVLEPSAGQGAIVKVINEIRPIATVKYCEIMELNRKQFKGVADCIGEDFLELETPICLFDCIVANPPFSKNQDIAHFMKMYDVCKSGGRIISIMSNHWRNSTNKKEQAFKEFLATQKAEIYDIEAGEFSQSGTMVSTCYIVLDKE